MNTYVVTRLTANGKLPKKAELSLLLEEIRSGKYREIVEKSRKERLYGFRERSEKWLLRLPQICYSSVLSPGKEGLSSVEYTGIICLEAGQLSGREEAVRIRNKAAASEYTLAAFLSPDETAVCILCLFRLMDGTLPEELKMAMWFHSHAYQQALGYYTDYLECYIHPVRPNLQQIHRMGYDPHLCYQPDPLIFRMAQPYKLYGTEDLSLPKKGKDPLSALMPGKRRSRIVSFLFETSLRDTFEKTGGYDKEDPKEFWVRLAENCLQSGVPEEEMIKYTVIHLSCVGEETELRLTVRNVYEKEKLFGQKPCISKEMLQHIRLREFMERRYMLRFNVLKNGVEYNLLRSVYYNFRPVGEREMNGICLDAQDEGLFIWDRDVRRYLSSNRVPLYNPLEEYVNTLPEWDGKDHIRAFASRIRTSRQGWENQFYKWFVYMVAQWIFNDELHANSTALVLIGPQGYRKSTFCKLLLPPELRDYYKEHLDLGKKKEAEEAITRFALINLDEFDSLSHTNHNYLKHLMQKSELNARPSFETQTIRKKRYASFVATCNRYDLLDDPTGSRRYICLELTDHFDMDTPINYPQLYAQAKAAIHKNEQYWFTAEEEKQITQTNAPFNQLTVEGELFRIYFRAADEQEVGEWLTATEILLLLKSKSKVNLSISKKSINRFGVDLKNLEIPKKHIKKGNVYHVIQL